MIRLIENKEIWDAFVRRHSGHGAFLQSWGWGEFQKERVQKVWRLGYYANDELKAVVLLTKHPLKFGYGYFYTPRGPVTRSQDPATLAVQLGEFKKYVHQLALEQKAIFWRLEPGWTSPETSHVWLLKQGFRKAPVEIQPRHTLIMDIGKVESELLKEMKPKTRYNIGVAIKHGVQVKKITPSDPKAESYVEKFYGLLGQTSSRQNFKTHSLQYFKKMWTILAGENSPELNLFLAESKGELLGGILVAFWGDSAIYMHGGMTQAQKEVMAPYILQWSAIKEAKSRGCNQYDFWGVASSTEGQRVGKEKNWEGLTRFKIGFTPATKISEYPGPHDLPVNPYLYLIYRLLKARPW